MIDTLRPDHLAFYGYPRDTAPFLRELASRSAVFVEAVSTSSWTAPATASLFTGLYPTHHGVVWGFRARKEHLAAMEKEGTAPLTLYQMPSSLPTLPELLRDAGYRTFGLAANINIGPEAGFDRGFDRFERFDMRPIEEARMSEVLSSHKSTSVPAEEVYDRLLEWEPEIRESHPYFLYLHLNDAHAPYHKRRPWYEDQLTLVQAQKSAYDSEISYTDRMLERVYERFGLDRGTILFVLSDHGEAFGEHGYYMHGRGLHRELNRILLMVHAPQLGVEARTFEARVSIIDVLPTLTDLLGHGPPPARDGWSLGPLLADGAARDPLLESLKSRVLFAHRMSHYTRGAAWAVMRSNWKLINESGRRELYDTDDDPGEQRNLLADRPEVRASLERELLAFQTRPKPRETETVEVTLDAEMREALEALGYVESVEASGEDDPAR